ncbi:MAG TPA: MFS transporter [Geminicoccaceae bacterium]
MTAPSLVRPIALLASAAFASVATMRVADPLVPQVAREFHTTVGEAAVIATAFAFAYGTLQLVYGPLGDRFGKVRLVAIMTLVSAATVASAGFAPSLELLALARLASGASAAAIVPLSMAWIGDHVDYAGRQTVLARFLTGTILGIVAGQVFGGVFGELLGWRAPFFILAGVFLTVALLLLRELRSGRLPPPILSARISVQSIVRGYTGLFRRFWVRVVLITVFVEGFLFYGGFTFVGAHLRAAFDLDYASIGLILAALGLGGLAYALTVHRLVATLGERGLSLIGGLLVAAAFTLTALGPLPAMPVAVAALGLGLHMLHNTLQTNATQMAPEARGLAVSTFANALFLGQAFGVALAGLLVDRIGFPPVFLAAGLLLALTGAAFAALLARRPAG